MYAKHVISKYLWIHVLDHSAYFVTLIFTKYFNAFFSFCSLFLVVLLLSKLQQICFKKYYPTYFKKLFFHCEKLIFKLSDISVCSRNGNAELRLVTSECKAK